MMVWLSRVRYRRNVLVAWLAHRLVDAAERLMPSGFARGRFERPAEEMRGALASCASKASRAESDLIVARIRLARAAMVYDDILASKDYATADKLRDAFSSHDWAGPVFSHYFERFDVLVSNGGLVNFVAKPQRYL